ncbi:MAG: hypothetical protein WD872_13250 [Pirellulaceae bacterium]
MELDRRAAPSRKASPARRSEPTKPALADVLDIVTALDRGQGYTPLAGGKQRQRVRVLASLEELPRLIVWYGR